MTLHTPILDATTSAHQAAAYCAHGHHHPHLGGVFLGVGLTLLTLFLVRAIRHRRRHGFGRRSMMHHVFRRLDTSPSQEKVIREALESLREQAWSLRGQGEGVRKDLGRAVAGDSFEASSVDAAFAGPTDRLPELRAAVAQALGRIHEVLTPSQRKELAAMLEAGPRFFFHRRRHGC